MKIKNILFQILLILFTVFTAPVFGDQTELDRCITGIEQRYGQMKDIHASFKQETFLGLANRTEKAEGEVYIKKGGRMFWDYKLPSSQKIILDGDTLWVYLPDEKQVMKNSFSAVSSHIVVDLFHGKSNIRERFKASLCHLDSAEKIGKILLELLPKEFDPTIKRLVLEIDPAGFLITKTVLEDELGTKTTLMFNQIKVDTGLDNSFFKFTPPPGVEVFSPPRF